MQSTEEIECGENEVGQSHSLRVIRRIGGGQVGLQTAEPVFDVFLLVEYGTVRTGRHQKNQLQNYETIDSIEVNRHQVKMGVNEQTLVGAMYEG